MSGRLPEVPRGTPAVLLLSGGLDSTTLLALATTAGYAVHAMTFRYGQRHGIEIDRARAIGERWGVARHVLVDIDLRVFGGSALTADIDVPKGGEGIRSGSGGTGAGAGVGAGAGAGAGVGVGVGAPNEIPVTYVPARNTIFLSFALALAETIGASDIMIGVNALDYSGYPDCRPEYIAAYERMANLATRAGVEGTTRTRIVTPLIDLSKADIIRTGLALGVDYEQTISCYDPAPDGTPCGRCDACLIRQKGFAEALG
ncbi:MAG: 7-cyano-7-deazaguanine synthase QueC [Gemmatimonadaceae bacterium]